MRKKIKLLLILSVVLVALPKAYSQTMSGLAIMTKYDEVASSNYEHYQIKMTLVNNKGKERIRSIEQHLKTDDSNARSTLIKFLAPSDVKGTGFLSLESVGSPDVRWLFLPAMGRSRRISATNDKDNFMGTDLTYEDINRERLKEHSYEVTGSTTINGADCYEIVAKPNTEERKKRTGYSQRIIFIDKKNFTLNKIVYFDKDGVKFKTLESTDFNNIDNTGKWRANKIEIKNLKTSHSTILLYGKFKINVSFDEGLFTKRELETNY